MLNEKLLQYVELSTKLLKETKDLKSEIDGLKRDLLSLEDLNIHLLDKIDKLEDTLEDRELYIQELEYDLDKLEADDEERAWIDGLEEELIKEYKVFYAHQEDEPQEDEGYTWDEIRYISDIQEREGYTYKEACNLYDKGLI